MRYREVARKLSTLGCLTRRGFSDTCQGGHGPRHSTQAADRLLLAPSPSGEGWGEGRAR